MPVEAEEAASIPERASGGSIATAVLLGLLAFVATAGVLHATVLNSLYLHADIRSEKLALLRGWHGKLFSAAFGTSHLHNGFDPRAFDEALRGSAMATHTANMAVEGGSQTEQYVMAQEFLKQLESPAQAGAQRQPCLVMLELNAGSNFTNDHLVHPRAINIYDWPTAQLVTKFVSPQMNPVQRYGRVGYALAAMGLHYANVGMLSNAIFAPPLSEETLRTQTEDDHRGLIALPYHASYLPRLYAIEAKLPKHPEIRQEPTLPGNVEMVERLARMSPVRGVSFVYVVMPRLDDLGVSAQYVDHLRAQTPWGAEDVPVINVGRADKYPEMYDPRLWYDDAHLTGKGAAMISKIVAEQIQGWYAAHGGPLPCGG
jgi:hypothetical protein